MMNLLEQDTELSVIGLATNGKEAFDLCCKHEIDIVIMDVRMPICDGIEGTKLIKKYIPSIKVVMFTTFEDQEYIKKAIKYGAEGYVLKDSGYDHIRMAIKSVYKGYPVFHKNVLDTMVESISENEPERPEIHLTATEQNVLNFVVEGKSNKQIASLLMLSEGRIRNIISELFVKTNTHDRTQLAVFAVRSNLVE